MGNSANVNPPAKCSRADRTPIRSSERSPTGGGIPSGSSATHSETMCDIDEMSLAASEGDWHPTLTNPSSTPSGRVQDEAEVMSSVLTRGYVVPEPHFFTPRLGRLQASEISRDVCFPATQDPFDIGSGSCAPTGGTPGAEIEGETSTPSATFSREGTLTGRPQGEQHRARTFTATALIGRYGTAPASSPKPDPFQGLAPTYSQSFSVLPGCTCSRSHTPLDCARQTRPHALARRRVVYTRQLLPLSNRQTGIRGAYACESTFPPSNRLGQCAIYLFFLPKHMAKKLVPHLPPFLPRHWLRIGIPSITKQAPPGGWLGRAAFPLRPGYHVDLHLAVNYSVRTFHAFSSKDETIPISTIFLPTGRRWPLQRIPD
ncbi:hypothetical protein E1301_Tti023591 [Triplophysa tibetana]|uniref:Uncharacterized protein n=1 Tax=Triplophysa tibetana TaxID=1572043 RepID=A0A5A9NDQ6_9TELE|nr:hypothetical protein E1301_Tti023591 [Triplophysa tibetana]